MQAAGSPLLMDGPVSSCRPLGWAHCDRKDLHDSQMAKSRPGDTRSAEPSSGAAGTLQLPLVLPSACPLPSLAVVLLLPLLTSDVSMEFLASLTFLTPLHPQSLPTSSSGFCPELQQTQLPLEPEIAPSPPARAPGLGGDVETCSPLTLSLGSGPVRPVLEPGTASVFLIFPVSYLCPALTMHCLHQNLCDPRCRDAHQYCNTLPSGGCFNLGHLSQRAQLALAVPLHTSIRSLKPSKKHEHFTSIFSHLYF